MKSKMLMVRVPNFLLEELKNIAKTREMTMSEIVRYLIQRFVDEEKQNRREGTSNE